MAKSRTSTKILELRGAFKKNPQRRRSEPEVKNQLRKTAPRYLNADQKSAWRKILKIAPPGVLMESDELIVASVACLWAQFTETKGRLDAQLLIRLEIHLGKLGMTPADLSRVSIGKTKINEFDED